MRQQLIVDTGPIVAWLDRSDQWHSIAVEATKVHEAPFRTNEPVLAEACFLLRHHPKAIARLGKWLNSGILEIPFQLEDHADRVFALMHKYRDLPMSLADASLVRMVELNLGTRLYTFDQHFRIYRDEKRRQIPLLEQKS
ncbi:MAG: type II toxin-antitoxin system VapC family toxin [Puniceicoccaceae bacterium]